ncbi:MAG: tetratricopeptide repeat protein [Deltaproteobacteria bacterium]|nr:tetratricopeptide repeat protein [Deltaproteobacteria bacterium]
MLKRSLYLAMIVVVLSVASCAPKAKPVDLGLSHYKMAQSYMAAKDYTAALDEMLQAVNYKPNDAEYQATLAMVYFEKKAFVLSETHYKKSLQLRPGDPTVQNNLAALYLSMQRWDDAASLFRHVADNLLFRYQSRALIGLGVANFHGGHHMKAVLAFKEVLDGDPSNTSALYLLSKSYYSMAKYDLARQYLERTLLLVPDNIDVHFLLGEALLQLEKNDAAAMEFREVANRADRTEKGQKAREYLQLLDDKM